MRILITRPEPDASIDAEHYRAEGHSVTVLPLLNIVSSTSSSSLLPAGEVSLLSSYIFISKNAVRYLPTSLREKIKQVFAVGPSTAQLLQAQGFQNILAPSTHEGSEALLALSELQNIKGQSFVIVRGTKGRELLADTLCARGASVHYLPVYTVDPVELTPAQLIQLRQPYDRIIITSMSTLKCALALGISKQAELLVLSRKMAEVAKHLGWRARCEQKAIHALHEID